MSSFLRTALILPCFSAALGCGLLLAQSPDPIVQGKLPDDPSPREVLATAFQGEIRDFATFRLEPDAVIEFWSDDPDYTPIVKLDGRGAFSVRIDSCRRAATPGESAAIAIITGFRTSCLTWIGRFAVRARLGTRCSLPVDGQSPPLQGDGPLVLWLRDCYDAAGRLRSWRTAVSADDPPPPVRPAAAP